ncbi:hypothetical protein BZA05DRAFT_448421 [Tricharina praecox]|uniref:uncharacterized protein n=1 Tax=Tricharina praecox TaxID=43433 RepID=UPI0022200C4B|nr:uncharacterized protein BZA05DRAFT_448421 [Tricharina praecox]KAI5844335.1 hypothetical protein BZA05DRAFT_448421 [Tricharina praecox]
MGAISQCQTRINGDEKEIYLSPKCGFSNGDGKNNEGKVLFVASKTGGPLSIRPHDNSNGLLEVVSVLADAPMIPAFAFILPDPGVEMKDYKIQVGPFSLFLPTRKDAHELHEVLTKQHIHISVRATVKLERRKKHALALKSAGPNLILKESLVQLWTEVGKPIHSREVWASQSNAPPQFVSRLVVFNTEEDDMFFVSIPYGDNHLQWSKDLGQRCITISRSLKAKIKGYKFAKTASGLPGIHMKKEKFEAHESNRNCEKYSTVHLEFVGDKAQTLIDFKEFRDCYNGLKKGRG